MISTSSSRVSDVSRIESASLADFADLPPYDQRFLLSEYTATIMAIYPEGQVTWTLENLTTHVVTWLTTDSCCFGQRGVSHVVLGSLAMTRLLEPALGTEFVFRFQRMLHALLHARVRSLGFPYTFSGTDFQQVAAPAGSSVLAELDNRLTPDRLAKCSHQQLQALFLVIFGATLAVGYASAEIESPELPVGPCGPSANEMILIWY
jgi:hypothetical protein